MTLQTTRRQFLARSGTAVGAVALGGVLAACGADDDDGGGRAGAQALTAQLLWVKDVQNGGYWIAEDRGYYERERVAVDWLAGGPNLPTTVPVIASGKAGVSVGEPFIGAVDAANKGSDVVLFGTVFQTSPLGLMSRPDAPIRTAEDVVGKKIGLQQGGKQYVDGLLNVNGLPLDYEQVRVGFDPQPLLEGACDGYLCYVTSQPVNARLQGEDVVATTFADMGFQSGYPNLMLAERGFIEQNRDLLVRFLRASIQGWQDYMRDPRLGARLAVEDYGKTLRLDLEAQEASAAEQVKLMESPLTKKRGIMWISKEEVEGPIQKSLRAAGTTTFPDVDRFVDTSLLEEAYAELPAT